MACGVPVVGSDSGEIPHVIGDGGRTYPEGNVEALGRCITDICAQPDYYAALCRSARQRVLTHYTQEALATRYADIYRRMYALHHGNG